MDTQFQSTVEHTVFARDVQVADVDVHLRRDDLCHLIKHTDAVDASQTDGGNEEEFLVHIPFHVKDAVAEARLQFGGHRTVALVDLYLVLVVDIAQGVVTGDGVATRRELILTDGLLVDVDRFLAVELLGYDKQFDLRFLLLRPSLSTLEQ